MCEACKEYSKIYDASQRLLVTCFHSQKDNTPMLILVQGNDGDKPASGVTITVNFCPWCGRDLRNFERSEYNATLQ